MVQFRYSIHDSHPPEVAMVDKGLEDANNAAAPLHEVRPLSCFAHDPSGEVIGGAVGRWWGECCELQQLWVHLAYRRKGVGSQLVRMFEEKAATCGCRSFYLETFNFQAPALYQALGYEVAYKHSVYPHGIIKFIMVKHQTLNAAD